ncbi:MAG TPA: hypothetical protein VFE62_19935 [Gemmataceae bacterium]|nr:hypothetical protein [Gemmataceae bacterium]
MKRVQKKLENIMGKFTVIFSGYPEIPIAEVLAADAQFIRVGFVTDESEPNEFYEFCSVNKVGRRDAAIRIWCRGATRQDWHRVLACVGIVVGEISPDSGLLACYDALAKLVRQGPTGEPTQY